MKYTIMAIALLFMCCSTSLVDEFTYEVVNNHRYLSVTPNNLIKMYELSASEQSSVLEDIGYQFTEGIYDYQLKEHDDDGVFDYQNIATQNINKKVFSVVWVSVKGNDRLEDFRRLASEKPNVYSKTQDIYLLKQNGKTYMAKINDLIVGKEVSITEFKI